MNIAHLLIPKQNVAYLYEDFTIRQALEKMRRHGYSAIPVINRTNQYVGSLSEGDLLWYLIDYQNDKPQKMSIKSLEKISVADMLGEDKYPPARITATVSELLNHALNQNFVPVIDDRDLFIGIVTRKDILRSLCSADKNKKILSTLNT
jgi:CBS domain-containing protein